jgi:hypothetical protein
VQAGRRKRKRKAIEPKRGGDSECHHLAGHHLPSKCNKERKEEATKA